MSELTILTYPHEILKTPTQPIAVFDDALQNTVKQMIALMYKEDGVGLAAPQVGLSWRLFVIDTSTEGNDPRCLINPVIVDKQGLCDSQEGCLSLPGLYLTIKRAASVTVEYQDEFGESHSLTATDLAARAIQHEYDHLDGILFLDRLSRLKRMMAAKKFKKNQRVEG